MSSREERLDRLASFLLDPCRSEFVAEQGTNCVEEGRETEKASFVGKPAVGQISGCMVKGREASTNMWRWEVSQCDPTLLDIPGLEVAMDRLHMSRGWHFDLHLSGSRLASKVNEHCADVIAKLIEKGCRFKIGLTTDPCNRWFNPEFGYEKHSTFQRMSILAVLKSTEGAAYLEASLIREFGQQRLCCNRAPGGEGASNNSAPPAFVYVAHSGKSKCG